MEPFDWLKEHNAIYNGPDPKPALAGDVLCRDCRRKYGPLRPIEVSERMHEMIHAVMHAAAACGTTSDPETLEQLNSFLNVALDTLYRQVEKTEKRARLSEPTVRVKF